MLGVLHVRQRAESALIYRVHLVEFIDFLLAQEESYFWGVIPKMVFQMSS